LFVIDLEYIKIKIDQA